MQNHGNPSVAGQNTLISVGHQILFDCCVLPVVVVVRHRIVSLLILKILASTGATLLAPANVFLPSLLLLFRLFDCCVHPRQIQLTLFLLRRRITNIQSGHHRHHHHHCCHRGCRGSGVHSTGDGHCLHHCLHCCRLSSRTAASSGCLSAALPLPSQLQSVTVPPLKIWAHSSPPPLSSSERPHFSSSERFIVV